MSPGATLPGGGTRWGEGMRHVLASVLLIACTALPASAGQDYTCGIWRPKGTGVARVTAISVLKGTAILTEGKVQRTLRMPEATPTRRVYLDKDGLFIIHGAFVRSPEGPAFGDRITLQRLVHDPKRPVLVQTDCEERK